MSKTNESSAKQHRDVVVATGISSTDDYAIVLRSVNTGESLKIQGTFKTGSKKALKAAARIREFMNYSKFLITLIELQRGIVYTHLENKMGICPVAISPSTHIDFESYFIGVMGIPFPSDSPLYNAPPENAAEMLSCAYIRLVACRKKIEGTPIGLLDLVMKRPV